MLNFIQIITGEIIKCFTRGIINIHASRLPPDRGTSPVMCSFARNEKEIFATIYQADQGVDTGSIYHQWPIPVVKEDTLFSINCRVCSECGNKLVEILPSIYNLKLSKQVQDSSTVSNYNSWPDQSHARLMLANKKAFISFSQVYRLLIGNSTDLLQN